MLFINACVRQESRTKRLADHLIQKLVRDGRTEESDRTVSEVKLCETVFPAADADFLKRRDRFIAEGDFSDPMFDCAREFAEAETIIVAAPYWDLSFPASLKQYFEQINVVGLTFHYPGGNEPEGLCRAKRLYYVTTAGGSGHSDVYGFGYVKELAEYFYGIPETFLIRAEGLDLPGADVETILAGAKKKIDEILS